MTVLDRKPVLQVTGNGELIPRVVGVHVDRGLDQEFAKAQITVQWPAHGQIKKGAHIVITTGVDTIIERFIGYVKNISAELWAPRLTLDCVDVMGYLDGIYPSEDHNLDGLTDTEIVTLVLSVAGIPDTMIQEIHGLDEIISDFAFESADIPPALVWGPEQSALSMIKQMDDVSQGYRTYALTSGQIIRRYIPHFPSFFYVRSFTDGIDFMSGSMSMTEEEPTTEVHIGGSAGDQSIVYNSSNLYAWQTKPYYDVHAMIQKKDSTVGFISTEDVANYVLDVKKRNVAKIQITTEVDDFLDVANTVLLDSVHLYVLQNLYIQNIAFDSDPSGKWRQTLTLISELMDNENAIPTSIPFGPLAGTTLAPAPTAPIMPSNLDIMASFVILGIDKETLADSTNIYIVTCSDMSTSIQGTIVERHWTASGTGVVVTEGTEQQFTTAFTDLADAVITIEVTDSNGSVGTASQMPINSGVPIRIRKLYVITDTTFEAFDGNVWRTHTPSNAHVMTALGHGPIAAAGDMFLYTTDDLVTPANEVVIRPGVNITAVWIEPDVSPNNIAAGFEDGGVATSGDGGATWTVRTAPGGGAIRRIIISRFVLGEVHAINDTGYYNSIDYGQGWALIRGGDFVDLQLSHAGRNVLVTAAGSVIRAESGTAFTFPVVSPVPFILNVTEHIRQDKIYAQDSNNRTWQQSGELPGSFELLQGVDIPEGTVQVRGSYRDGLTVDMVYFAAGTGGLWKTIDGYRTSQGYLKLRNG